MRILWEGQIEGHENRTFRLVIARESTKYPEVVYYVIFEKFTDHFDNTYWEAIPNTNSLEKLHRLIVCKVMTLNIPPAPES